MLPCVTPDFNSEFAGQKVHSALESSNTPGNVVASHAQSARLMDPDADTDRVGHLAHVIASLIISR